MPIILMFPCLSLPKPDKDIRLLKNWRPISLLNTDYKILTKLLANRLQNVIHKIVSEDQTGYIKNRYIGENIRTVIDVIKYTSLKKIPGLLLFIDFEKAFDTVSWPFLFKTLNHFNFGENFKKWINVIYAQPRACVLNNGYSTKLFTISRGIRQGCPISALLFLLVVEILAINIKENKDINGIQVENEEIHITQMADDTTLFIRDKTSSLEKILSLLQDFHQHAGLKLNKDKTKAILLGNSNFNLKQYGIAIVKDNIKTLGIKINKDLSDIENINFDEKLIQIKNVLNMWKSRQISIKGRITVLRSQVLPIILYTASMLYTPERVMRDIEELFFDFIWPNKKHHVRKKILMQGIGSGGLKMPDIFASIKAIKVMWIKRLLKTSNTYSLIANQNSKIMDFQHYFSHNMSKRYLPEQPDKFYGQILDFWEEIIDVNASNMSLNDILNEKVCYNKHILIDNKPITNRLLMMNNIECLNDLLKPDKSFKTNQDLNWLTTMEYNQLITSIPCKWKKMISDNNRGNLAFKPISDLQVKIGTKYKKIIQIKCKEFYWHQIEKSYDDDADDDDDDDALFF